MLSHSNNVSTLYGHMSRFAKNIRVGSHVQQGDVIGYVGMTGLATGPHLHYEYLMNGVHKDPQTVRLPGAEPLQADAMIKFRSGELSPLLARALCLGPPSGRAAQVERCERRRHAATGSAPGLVCWRTGTTRRPA